MIKLNEDDNDDEKSLIAAKFMQEASKYISLLLSSKRRLNFWIQ